SFHPLLPLLYLFLENPLEIHYVTVEIADLNDHSPKFPEKIQRLEISESTLPGAQYQLQMAHDPDVSQNDHFRLEIKDRGKAGKTPILQLQRQLDREAKNSHKIVLRAIDGGTPPKTGTVEIYINVIDVNDNMPIFTKEKYSATLQENAPVGSTVIQVNATDMDAGPNGEVVYSFGSDDKDKITEVFSINSVTGEIIVKGHVDFEEKDSYDIDIQASDKGSVPLKTYKSVIIKITDVNDNPPVIEVASLSSAVSEDARPGTTVALISITDLDSGVNGKIISYVLSQNGHFRLEVKDRGEDRKTPSLVLEKPLDRESVKSHVLLLTALDGGKPPKSGNMTIVVNVSDVNDNPPVFSQESYIVSIKENSPPGTTVIQVSATDLDEGSNGEVMYSFGNHVDARVRERFSLNPVTGVIVVTGVLDFEECSRYEVDVQASDKGAATLKTDKTVVINVVDVNDNEPNIEVTSFSHAIPEDSKPGTTVALISVKDADSGLNGKVMCYINPDLPFLLTPSLQNNAYSLVTKTILDREKEARYNVRIIAKDAGETSLSSEKIIPVLVSDINDNMPEFHKHPYIFYLTENNTPGEKIFSVSAGDNDEGRNALVSYLILRDQEGTNIPTSFLNVNSETGDVVALKSFDFETLKTFQFRVVATDSGTPSLSSNVTVNVFILDQNDNAPKIISVTACDKDKGILFIMSIIVLIAMQCSKSTDYTSKYIQETNYDGTLCHSIQYRSGDKRYMLVGPRMSIGSTIVPGSHANTLVLPDRRRTSEEVRSTNLP
uniref:Protocadherin 2 alpha a 15 n=1 Tax=Poecilia reticulata TaxID=8081 RepID=A0A3P9MWT9_POERE